MYWRGRIKSSDDIFNFRLPIFDLGESNMTQIFQANLLSFRSDNPKSKIENLKWWGIFAIAFAFAFGGAVALAQQAAKAHRVCFFPAALGSRCVKKHFVKGCANWATLKERISP